MGVLDDVDIVKFSLIVKADIMEALSPSSLLSFSSLKLSKLTRILSRLLSAVVLVTATPVDLCVVVLFLVLVLVVVVVVVVADFNFNGDCGDDDEEVDDEIAGFSGGGNLPSCNNSILSSFVTASYPGFLFILSSILLKLP